MKYQKQTLIGSIVVLILYGSPVYAKSVYAITDHCLSTMRAFEIDGSELSYQGDVKVTDFASGAVDVGIDSMIRKLFITYEGSSKIVWADPITLEQEGYIDIRDDYAAAGQLAGIVADEANNFVYTVERADNKLYVLSWDAQQEKLVLMDPNYPDQPYDPNSSPSAAVSLSGVDSAYGLSVDGDILYVSDNTSAIHYYDTSGWAHLGERNVGRAVADIAIDPNNGFHPAYLYGGALYYESGMGHKYLIRHNLDADPNEVNPNVEQDIGTVAIGVAVDEAGGLVYTTTSSGEIRAYNCWGYPFVCTYSEDVSTGEPGSCGPAGLCVPSGDVEYIPPVAVTKEDDMAEGECICPQGQITYSICYKYQWNDPNDANMPSSESDPSDFVIVDYLPAEVDFDWASDGGLYAGGPAGEPKHFVIWDIGALEPGAEDCVQVRVAGNRSVLPGGNIINVCDVSYMMGEREHGKSLDVETQICGCSQCGEVVYVDCEAGSGGDGSSWQEAYNKLQAGLDAAWPCDEVWVAAGTYGRDIEPSDPNAAFVVPHDVSLYGGFAGYESERWYRDWWSNPAVLSRQGEPNNVGYVVSVGNANSATESVLDGFTISDANGPGVYCPGGTAVMEHNFITDNEFGVLMRHSATGVLRNNWIYENSGDGIRLDGAGADTVIRNNTVADNGGLGVNVVSGPQPVIVNCILWGHPDGNSLDGCSASYSCLQDPNDPEGDDPGADVPDEAGNISCNPSFVNAGLDDYRLMAGSGCIDAGDGENSYGPWFGESDIEHHQRNADGNGNGAHVVDMGADEYCDESESNPADFYPAAAPDGRVDSADYAVLGNAWLTESGETGYNEICDLYDDNAIDLRDLKEFVGEWLWCACWSVPRGIPAGVEDEMMGIGGEGPMGGSESTATAEDTAEVEEVDIERILTWLDEIWLSGELDEVMSEGEYLEFRESVEQDAGSLNSAASVE